jgi:hypothetical protein
MPHTTRRATLRGCIQQLEARADLYRWLAEMALTSDDPGEAMHLVQQATLDEQQAAQLRDELGCAEWPLTALPLHGDRRR